MSPSSSDRILNKASNTSWRNWKENCKKSVLRIQYKLYFTALDKYIRPSKAPATDKIMKNGLDVLERGQNGTKWYIKLYI